MLVIRFKRIAAIPISIIVIIIGIGKGRMEIDGERRGTTTITITTTIIIISGEEGRVEDRFLFDVFVEKCTSL